MLAIVQSANYRTFYRDIAVVTRKTKLITLNNSCGTRELNVIICWVGIFKDLLLLVTKNVSRPNFFVYCNHVFETVVKYFQLFCPPRQASMHKADVLGVFRHDPSIALWAPHSSIAALGTIACRHMGGGYQQLSHQIDNTGTSSGIEATHSSNTHWRKRRQNCASTAP
jgi:hypothetical protein